MPRRQRRSDAPVPPGGAENADEHRVDASGNALTPIHPSIHCAATNAVEEQLADTNHGQSEVDDLAVQTFLDTLREVAFAIARRKGGGPP